MSAISATDIISIIQSEIEGFDFNENGEKASSRAVCERLYALAGGVLYNKKEAKDSFYDVIIGSNGRFDALIGYDLCTGLGVPTR